jgi:hypothetical protein
LSWLCPVCNGLQTMSASCPSCSAEIVDYGRYNDYLGPYSPYRDIDELSQTNGISDFGRDSCAHAAACLACGSTFTLLVKGWKI